MAKKNEKPIEGEVLDKNDTCCGQNQRRGGAGLFFGLLLLCWGIALIADTYLGTDLMSNLWPGLAIVLGAYLIFSSFKR